MKRLFFFIVAIAILLAPTSVWAGGYDTCSDPVRLDYIDIGLPDSEEGHKLKGWGPIEPDTSKGNYGGVTDTRVAWEPGAPDTKHARSASFTFKVPKGFKATQIKLRVLDGLADDSFIVRVNSTVYEYTGLTNGEENWIEHTINLRNPCSGSCRIKVVIQATGPAWKLFDTYGQLAVDEVELLGCPTFAPLSLYEKDPDTWEDIEGGAWGRLIYRVAGSKFHFTFNGRDLEPKTEYSLIYYADPWPGDNPGAFIASGTTNNRGRVTMTGQVELNTDIPEGADENYPDGGKIWLVLSSDYDAAARTMIAWNPTEYLFEDRLITYDDTDL
ncbi:MAG: hypothetical protein KAT23_01605 [Anaerolineales bacterium]|nr:hypothetical protein [Anaerolineales bacterium]